MRVWFYLFLNPKSVFVVVRRLHPNVSWGEGVHVYACVLQCVLLLLSLILLSYYFLYSLMPFSSFWCILGVIHPFLKCQPREVDFYYFILFFVCWVWWCTYVLSQHLGKRDQRVGSSKTNLKLYSEALC